MIQSVRRTVGHNFLNERKVRALLFCPNYLTYFAAVLVLRDIIEIMLKFAFLLACFFLRIKGMFWSD